MSGNLSIGDIGSLHDLERALGQFASGVGNALQSAEREMQQSQEWIAQRVAYWQREYERAQREVQQAERALNRCEASGYRDSDGHYHQPDCSSERRELERAIRYLKEAQANLENAKAWRSRIEEAVQAFQREAVGAKDLVGQHTQNACSFLRDAAGRYEQVRQASGSIGSGVSGIALGSALAKAFGGHHKAIFRREKQEFLRQLPNDPNTPEFVKGWIQQELNRIEQIREARSQGLRPPGGSPNYIKVPPGFNVSHKFPNLDMAESFSLEHGSPNKSRGAKGRWSGSWLR